MEEINNSFLPEIISLTSFEGDWPKYINHIHELFRRDILDHPPDIKRTLRIRKFPITDGRENAFWHLVSEGEKEEDREPVIERCEKIVWIKPILEKMGDENFVYTWQSKRGNELNLLVALKDFSYVVILADRNDYVLLLSAYPVERKHRREKLKKEYEKYKAAEKKKGT